MQLDGNTKVLGIFGDPVAHSLSPKMQNAAIEAAGINAVYVPFHIRAEQLEEAVAAIRILGLPGVNVTVPHKESVVPFLDEVDTAAQQIGAVNTIVNRHGSLVGYNTDGYGFLDSLEKDVGFHSAGKDVILLGAGGAARAALVALAQSGAGSVVVANRTPEKAAKMVHDFTGHFPNVQFTVTGLETMELEQALAKTDLLVNTTTIGLQGDSFSQPFMSLLPDSASYYDMVYAPELTPAQREAQNRGLKFADGRGMLAGQGEAAFCLWFGVDPPEGIMRRQIAK